MRDHTHPEKRSLSKKSYHLIITKVSFLLLISIKTTINQMRDLTLKHFVLLFSFLLLACQDNEPEELGDPEMELAWEMVGEYLSSSRTESTDVDVTVIKYSSDLLYKTNNIFGNYNPISEETITAQSEPGGYVFWLSGLGVKELLAIEMDKDSQEALGENEPFEVVPGELWALWIPSDLYDDDDDDDDDDEEEEEEIHLKYDIVYKTNSGEVIRLDPKLQVKHVDTDE